MSGTPIRNVSDVLGIFKQHITFALIVEQGKNYLLNRNFNFCPLAIFERTLQTLSHKDIKFTRIRF